MGEAMWRKRGMGGKEKGIRGKEKKRDEWKYKGGFTSANERGAGRHPWTKQLMITETFAVVGPRHMLAV